MSKPKRQHFIPRSYLNNFADKLDEKYFIYGKMKGADKVDEPISTKDICIEKNLYTLPTIDAERKFDLEHFYADNIDSVFPAILSLLKDKSTVIIDFETRLKIITTSLSLYFRTPKFLNIQNQFFVNVLKHAFEGTKDDEVTISFLGEDLRIKREETEQIIKERRENNRIQFLVEHLESYERLVQSKLMDDISVYHIYDDSEFITSDNPVIIRAQADPTHPDFDEDEYFNQTINPFEKTNMIHLPIDRKTMLTIIPSSEKTTISASLRRMEIGLLDVMIYNSDIERYSEKWILGSKDGIEQHLHIQYEANVESQENAKHVENYKQRTLAFNDLVKLMEKHGVKSEEVKNQIDEMEKHPFISSDPNFRKLVLEIERISKKG